MDFNEIKNEFARLSSIEKWLEDKNKHDPVLVKEYQNEKKYLEYKLQKEMHKIKIDVGFGALIAEKYNMNTNDAAPELCIYLEDNDIMQNIVLVRKSIKKNTVECLVWTDSDDEDYTKKYLIDKYQEDF